MDGRDVDEAGWIRVRRTVLDGGEARLDEDAVCREEPLEIRVSGVSVAVVMRTPGADEELVRGFLLTEGIVDSPARVVSVRHCDVVEDPAAEDNVVTVSLHADWSVDLKALRRNLFASSSCGICGKATREAALKRASSLEVERVIPSAARLVELPDELRRHQTTFDRTGGLHAAGLFDAEGTLLVVREDVGRHNAVDKVVGWASRRAELEPAVLVVSGRVSFEIVQKALAARVPCIVAVSAPTSLAVELAMDGNITLMGFARGERACVYAGAERLSELGGAKVQP